MNLLRSKTPARKLTDRRRGPRRGPVGLERVAPRGIEHQEDYVLPHPRDRNRFEALSPLPNLLIIGAGKSGTTSLHAYLGEHPDIYMSTPKELRFFRRDDWRERLDWYARQFPKAAVRGESSPAYSLYPYRPSVSERIHEVIPDVRLIYLVRDPVQRAIASYVEFVALGIEKRPIAQALLDFDRVDNPHLCGSRYGLQLERYLKVFDREQILVIDQTELRGNRTAVLRRAFQFVGVDEDFSSPGFEATHNDRQTKVRHSKPVLWLLERGHLSVAQVQSDSVIGRAARAAGTTINADLDHRHRSEVADFLRADAAHFEELAGQSFRWPSFEPEQPAGSPT